MLETIQTSFRVPSNNFKQRFLEDTIYDFQISSLVKEKPITFSVEGRNIFVLPNNKGESCRRLCRDVSWN